MTRARTLLALSIILLTTLATSAHDTWLLARHSSVATGEKVWFDLTSSMTFPALDYSIKSDRVGVARYRINGKTLEISERKATPKSLAFAMRLPESGIASVWVELSPKSLELTAKQVEEYFDEINASAELRQSWKSTGANRRWREIYTKHAKTFVQVRDVKNDRSWADPVGMTLEIVPEKNPSALHPGDVLPVRVLRNGSPLANFSLGIVGERNSSIRFRQTDAEGRVSFRLARAGKWLLRGTDLRPSNKPDTEWESDFTTLTIEVH